MEMIIRADCDRCGNHHWLVSDCAAKAYRCPYCEASNRILDTRVNSHECSCGTWDTVFDRTVGHGITIYTANFNEHCRVTTECKYIICPHCEERVDEIGPNCPMCGCRQEGSAYPHIFSASSTGICKECSIKTIRDAFKGKVLASTEVNKTVHEDEKMTVETTISFDEEGEMQTEQKAVVEKMLGMKVVIDPNMPPDTIQLVDMNGRVWDELSTNL